MSQATTSNLNGVNVDQLVETIKAIQSDPEIAQFKFRSTTDWVKGGHCRTRIKEFYGAKQEDTTRTEAFILEGDEPAVLLSNDQGPNAVEAILHALGACLSVGVVYNAAARGITVNSLSFRIEGELDLHAFLGLSDTSRAGYENISVTIDMDTSASREKEEELVTYVKRTSPVLDIISNPVPVTVKLG